MLSEFTAVALANAHNRREMLLCRTAATALLDNADRDNGSWLFARTTFGRNDVLRYCADSRTIGRLPLISLRLLTKLSGRCQR
ncbi:hypothetical protein ABIB73_001398 [Bradyrhizobium sp. F1.4.3]